MYKRILVGDNERVLVTRNKRFAEILEPGEYRVLTFLARVEVECFNVRDLAFTSPWADFIVKERPRIAERYFTVVETSATEVGVVYADGKLVRVIAPGNRVAFWKSSVAVTAERIDVREQPEIPPRLIPALIRLGRESLATLTVVDEGKRGLVYIDGRFVRELGAGTYGFWSALGVPRIEIVEMRRQTVEVPGQEILTKDKVTLRVNISTVFEITNAAASRALVKDASELLYR
ncbi:MAG TPA: SPFH domain-containing protein, partial [Bryobacteraceae bacterium]|nr:SPFH domain-containing protein [Bryobacteraceae bacterium]